jgi:hypothetical protein
MRPSGVGSSLVGEAARIVDAGAAWWIVRAARRASRQPPPSIKVLQDCYALTDVVRDHQNDENDGYAENLR